MQAYGYNWPCDDPIDVEIQCIQMGGRWQAQGKWWGEGLFFHYKVLQSLLWPWKKWDPWSELILKHLLANRLTLLSGPANSTKTHSVAAFILSRYICFPVNNCNLISSTDSRSLELRIWGEIKKLYNFAKQRYPQTPGRIVESKQILVTDVEEDTATDYRSGLICVPCVVGGQFVGIGKYCFPAGTEVDTGIGTWPIQFIQERDWVLSAAGERRVVAVSSQIAPKLVRLHLSNRQAIDCTPEHPFFTSLGWVKAIDILPQTELISTHEAMQILREGFDRSAWQQGLLQPGMPKTDVEERLQVVREGIHPLRREGSFLHSILCSELENGSTGNREENVGEQGLDCEWKGDQQGAYVRSNRMRKAQGKNEEVRDFSEGHLERTSMGNGDGGNSEGRTRAFSLVPASAAQFEDQDWTGSKVASSPEIRSGFGLAGNQVGCRSRRVLPQQSSATREGQYSKPVFARVRVDRVEVLESGSDPRYNASEGGYRVYNLQVEGHPSYSVKGQLVHNCGIKAGAVYLAADELALMSGAFFDSIANLSKNPGFKCAGMFNPKDRTDVAGKLAEPEQGWETYVPTGKTMIWKTRFKGGVCIQLDGRDSPNNIAKEGEDWPYPHLINRDDISKDTAFYGEDSIQVSMMDYGIFPKDAQARRVVTRSMCERHRAQEEPIWSHEPLTPVFAIDAAYGAVGGDRCVGLEMAFGKCSDGQKRLAFIGQPLIIPVKNDMEDENGKPILPESQIVRWVKDYCENPQRLSPIPLSHIGFDSTGRGSLVKAFADEWGNDFYAIEFGGPPSERPVSAKITTPCNIYYFNFVTELWFNVSTLILADQCRGMPTAVMEEFCMRAWDMVKDKKVQVEPKSSTTGKPGCKQRMGRSPDIADCATIGVEVAQRLGFVLGQGGNAASQQSPRWLLELIEQQKQLNSSCRLQYR